MHATTYFVTAFLAPHKGLQACKWGNAAEIFRTIIYFSRIAENVFKYICYVKLTRRSCIKTRTFWIKWQMAESFYAENICSVTHDDSKMLCTCSSTLTHWILWLPYQCAALIVTYNDWLYIDIYLQQVKLRWFCTSSAADCLLFIPHVILQFLFHASSTLRCQACCLPLVGWNLNKNDDLNFDYLRLRDAKLGYCCRPSDRSYLCMLR